MDFNAGIDKYQSVTAVEKSNNSTTAFFKAKTDGDPPEVVGVKLYLARPPIDNRRLSRAAAQAHHTYQLMRLVDHPAFPRARELCDEVFLVMDWIDGQRLGDFVASKSFSSTDALRIGAQIARACDALSTGLTAHYPDAPDMGHGDLHFDNVLIERHDNGSISSRIVDLDHVGQNYSGRDTWNEDIIQQVRAAGRKVVQSPEYILGSVDYLDTRSDIFSLGSMICRMLTGKWPHQSSDEYLVKLEALHEGTLQPESDRCSGLCGYRGDPTLERLLDSMLKFDRQNRCSSMRAVAETLERRLERSLERHDV